MAGAGNAKGFVLVTTLWALAALALLAAYINHMVRADVDFAIEDKRVFEAELERRNTEATVTYLLATGRMTIHALILEGTPTFSLGRGGTGRVAGRVVGELRVTAPSTPGLGGVRFLASGRGGLIPVNTPKFPPLAAFLGHMGVPEGDVAQVLARIEDYIDSDDSLSLNGAERHEYRLQDKQAPLNWLMSSPLELMEVLGIDELVAPARWSAVAAADLTMRPVSGYQLQHHAPEVLAPCSIWMHKGCRRAGKRRKGPLSRPHPVAMLSGKAPGNRSEWMWRWSRPTFLRIVVCMIPWASHRRRYELTPLGKSAPWRKILRYSDPPPAHTVTIRNTW